MNFLKIQEKLAALHMDTSTVYTVGGDGNKACINDAYEYLYDILKNSEKVKRNMVKQKTLVTFTNKVGDLPADYDVEDLVSLYDFALDSDMTGIGDGRYFDFRVLGQRGSKKMYLEGPESRLYISYVPLRVDLSSDADTPGIPEELHQCIADFALYEYNRRIRDLPAAADALALAQSILDNKLATLG